MQPKLSPAQFAQTAVLVLGAASLIVAVWRWPGPSGLEGLLAIVAGILVMASISAVATLFERSGPEIQFSGDFLLTSLDVVARGIERRAPLGTSAMVRKREVEEVDPLSLDELLVRDPQPSLAKLRIDLERELRRLLPSDDLGPGPAPSLGRLADRLAMRGVIVDTLVSPIKQVASVCNRAVHGEHVTTATAAEVVSVGSRLLEVLRSFDATSVATSAA